ncbi:MAG: peroxin [Thelocarpon impressellum]|nr:MAG: peroxin [Thelocarpon impressellum]
MITATRNWLRRNRTTFAVGFGAVGVAYVASQYVLGKLAEARERMSSDRIAKENLRRRFEQNQEDCTFTVLALLPTATENVLEALPVEHITHELQQKKAERLARSGAGDVASSEFSSGPPSATDDDGRSLRSFQSEGYVHASQMQTEGEQTKKTKAQLWSELKINSITRAFTLLYTLALLTLLTRIQLNLLGRRNYLSSVVSLAAHATHAPQDSAISLENHDDDNPDQTYGNDFDTNRRYLTFSWWLLHRGWREVLLKVQAAVTEVFGPLNPREDVTLERLSQLTLAVRKKVEGETDAERKQHKWLSYLLPLRAEEDFVLRESGMTGSPEASTSPGSASPLRRLLDETSDLIDSPPFTHVLTHLLDAGFSVLVEQKLLAQAFKSTPPPSTTPSATAADLTASRVTELPDPATLKTKVASVLAVLTRQAHAVGNGVPNEYLKAMEGVRELEAFAAVVYSSNFEFEAVGAASAPPPVPLAAEAGEEVQAGEESLIAGFARAEKDGKLEESGELVEKGAEAGFEGAWGKAVQETSGAAGSSSVAKG